MSYDGIERRQPSQMDLEIRDKVIETNADVKYLIKNFNDHVVLDDKRQIEVTSKLEFHQKIVYGGVGILAAVELLTKFIK